LRRNLGTRRALNNGGSMRSLVAAVAATLMVSAVAHAEKRLFIIANDPDGYGIDRCLADGANCGRSIATAYCQSHDFLQASAFRKVERGDITGAVPTGAMRSCAARSCPDFVAIECSR
jgi:hypothetical protein